MRWHQWSSWTQGLCIALGACAFLSFLREVTSIKLLYPIELIVEVYRLAIHPFLNFLVALIPVYGKPIHADFTVMFALVLILTIGLNGLNRLAQILIAALLFSLYYAYLNRFSRISTMSEIVLIVGFSLFVVYTAVGAWTIVTAWLPFVSMEASAAPLLLMMRWARELAKVLIVFSALFWTNHLLAG